MTSDIMRPYLVIPKLIEQPTWGGQYITNLKGWQGVQKLQSLRIGQSYELFDKSNLSLVTSSVDPTFQGELTDSVNVENATTIAGSLALETLLAADPEGVLGKQTVERYGPIMPLLLKITQALGNSFQIHIKDGLSHPKWKAKPESWYYFEPGRITCGVKSTTNWSDYQKAVTELQQRILNISQEVQSGSLLYEKGAQHIAQLVRQYDPWQYVNVVEVPKKSLIDLSPCGIHHSWEEDLEKIPLGNVLYEIQLNVMDSVATIRNFDKGKMSKDGSIRPLHIDDYFALVDRSPDANNPQTHMRKSTVLSKSASHCYDRLMQTKYYTLDKLTLGRPSAEFSEKIQSFRHILVQKGEVEVAAGSVSVRVTQGHSVFVPAGCGEYAIRTSMSSSKVLISY